VPTGRLRAPGSQPADLAPRHPAQRARHRAGTRKAANGTAATGRCAHGQVVVSLFTRRYWYWQRQRPAFIVTVVSTSPQPCRFNVGARYLTVTVTGPRGRLWNSGDCARGAGSRVVVLHRGVPAVVWVSWNRHASAPGCLRTRRKARPGTFTATAARASLRSKGLIFVLGAPGIGAP
jgi:hypothetical protein